MPLVNVPDRYHSFKKWVKEVTDAAEMRFGSRSKMTATTTTTTRKTRRGKQNTRRRRKRHRKNSRKRSVQHG